MTAAAPSSEDPKPRWSLTLYVSGASLRSAQAIATLRTICDVDLAGDVELTILDAADHPREVVQDQIVAVPTLVKRSPGPRRHLVGNLSDPERVRYGLDLNPDGAGDHAPR